VMRYALGKGGEKGHKEKHYGSGARSALFSTQRKDAEKQEQEVRKGGKGSSHQREGRSADRFAGKGKALSKKGTVSRGQREENGSAHSRSMKKKRRRKETSKHSGVWLAKRAWRSTSGLGEEASKGKEKVP